MGKIHLSNYVKPFTDMGTLVTVVLDLIKVVGSFNET